MKSLILLMPLLLCQHSLVPLLSAGTLKALPEKKKPSNNSSISSLLIFGDSTVDPGNNNYIATLLKSNFPPYGRDFPNRMPTGRFTNGKLVTDFLAGYIGLKETIRPYLDPTLTIEELTSGVSFASAATGFDPLTAQITNVIPIQQQLRNFREYKARIEVAIGKEKAKALIQNAAFLLSCGINNHIITYFNTPLRNHTFTISEYQQFLLHIQHQFLQDLIGEGAQVIVVAGLPPLGCVPLVITLDSNSAFKNRQCVEAISSAARNYNDDLQKVLNALRLQHPNLKLIYADIYTPLKDMITNPTKYGFADVNTGCCATGLIELAVLCNPTSFTCPDDSKYIFWDSVHPSQATYYYIFKALSPLLDAFRF